VKRCRRCTVVRDDDIERNDVTIAEDSLKDGIPWTTSSFTEMQVCAG